MSCRKGKSTAKPKAGRFECDDCGAVVKKKSGVCDPKKIKNKKKSRPRGTTRVETRSTPSLSRRKV